MQIEKLKLKNGLETLFINQPGAQAGTVQIWFRAGSALEKKEDEGIAHFLEHMFFKGTKKRPGAQIAHDVESYGGEINAFTSFDYTCYYINSPSIKLKNTIDILMDMVSGPVFKKEDLIPEREVVFEEYRRSQDNASQFNFQQIQKSSFTGGYNHPILGTPKTIKKFSQAQLKSFRKSYYNLNNAMLVVAGDLKSKPGLVKKIEEFKLPKGKLSSFPKFNLKKTSQVSVHKKEVRQAVLTFTIQAPKYLEPFSASEDLAINCLAYGELSPLYKRLVTETSLATSVSGSTMFFNNGGVHFLRVSFPEKNLSKILSEYENVVRDIYENSLDEKSVIRIKNQYIASKIYERESIEAYAFSLGHGFAQNGDIHCESEFIEQIKKADFNAVDNSFKEIFSRPIHLTLQVPPTFDDKDTTSELKSFASNLNKLYIKKKATRFTQKKSNYDSEVKQITLMKGIELVHRYNPLTPTFVMHAYMKGGQTDETVKNQGIYQMLQKSLTYGYKDMSYHDLKNDLEMHSAYLNGFSGKNAYGLTMHAQSQDFNHLTKHFFGTLIEPTFPDAFLNLEKELVLRTLENQEEDPVKQCFSKFSELVYNEHPYSRNILGTKEIVQNFTAQDLKELHKESLENKKIVLTICGNITLETAQTVLLERLVNLKAREGKTKNKNKLKPIVNKNIVHKMEREQTQIFIGKPGYGIGHKEDFYLKLFTQHLSGQSSELFVDVRDRKGLCYAVQPVHHSSLEAGFWGIYIGSGHDKKDQAVAAIQEIIAKYKDRGFTAKELKRAKEMINGQNLLNIQTNDDYASFYSIPVLHELGIDYPHHALKKINEIKLEDFNKFLKKYLKSDWNKIEVGP
jgi:zinc protease